MTDQPELFARHCPFKGCRRNTHGPTRHGLNDYWTCTTGHVSISRTTTQPAKARR